MAWLLAAAGILGCLGCGTSTHGAARPATARSGTGGSGGGQPVTSQAPPWGRNGATITVKTPSSAMLPTIKIGAPITALVEHGYAPKLGDIILFYPPSGAVEHSAVCGDRQQGLGHRQACDQGTRSRSQLPFLKRVVAEPGNKITIINGHVYRNGVREHDPYARGCTGAICNFPTPITIPHGEYFVLGDNRGQSDDSRFWGPVPRRWILGKVISP